MLKFDEILILFQSLTVWSNGTARAPHKPLLALWAIGRCIGGRDRLAPYETVAPELDSLLHNFGPGRPAFQPQQPFWRLQKDKVWEIDRPNLVLPLTDSGDAYVSKLKNYNIHGGFTEPVFEAFRRNHHWAFAVARMLLDSHFPSTYHDEIMAATGIIAPAPRTREENKSKLDRIEELKLEYENSRRLKRNEKFRSKVLHAYENRCAVCEFSVRIDEHPVAIEAAHIQWHGALGPARTKNGLSLCALHHKLFDRGVFTLLPTELKVIVNEKASGRGFEESLGRYHEKKLSVLPGNPKKWPAPEYIEWHVNQVFKSPEKIFPS